MELHLAHLHGRSGKCGLQYCNKIYSVRSKCPAVPHRNLSHSGAFLIHPIPDSGPWSDAEHRIFQAQLDFLCLGHMHHSSGIWLHLCLPRRMEGQYRIPDREYCSCLHSCHRWISALQGGSLIKADHGHRRLHCRTCIDQRVVLSVRENKSIRQACKCPT